MDVNSPILPLVTLLIGSLLTWLITRSTKRHEWRIEVNKQLIQMRILAYEELISVTKGATIAGGHIIDGEFKKFPLFFRDSESYTDWTTRFIVMTGRVSHLIDSPLAGKLTDLQNYLAYLDDYLGNWDLSPDDKIDDSQLQKVGILLYEDVRKLTSAILEEAGRFYSDVIYNEKFSPSTTDRKPYSLPSDFRNLTLFAEKENIKSLAK